MSVLRWWPVFAVCALGFVPGSRTAPAQEPAAPERTVHRVAYEHAGGVSGSVMVIRALVNGMDTRLLFDTGAAFPLVIDTEVAQQRGLTGHYGVPVHGVGTSEIHMTAVESLRIGDWTHGPLTAGIMNIGHIRSAMGMLGTRIDGIVGMPVISGFRTVRLDFTKRRFELSEFRADETLPSELVAVRTEFARDLSAVRAIRAATAGGLGVDVEVAVAVAVPPGVEGEGGAGGGLRVTRVLRGSVAAAAGLAVGDRLTGAGEAVLGASPRDLRIAEALTGAGKSLSLQFTRDGKARTMRLTLGRWKTGVPLPAESEAEDF